MRKIFPVILVVILTLSFCGVSASQQQTLSWQQMQKMDGGRIVSPVSIFEDGGGLFMSESRAGGHYRLVWSSSRWKPVRKTALPLQAPEYIAADRSGKNVVVYTQERYSFLSLNRNGKTWEVFSSMQGAQPGFALYGGRKSRLFFSGNSLFALGYFYDNAGEYLSEWVVRIHPDRKGEAVFERILETSTPAGQALKFLPGAVHMKLLDINEKTAVLSLHRENDGCIVGYDIPSKEFFVIDYFDKMVNLSLSNSGKLCAYVIQPKGSDYPGVLFVYDLEKKQSVKCVPGDFFNPVFDRDDKTVAAGYYKVITGRLRIPYIDVISIDGNKSSTFAISGGERIFNWFFTGKNELSVLAGRDIHRFRIP
jgi:hypothetical protein